MVGLFGGAATLIGPIRLASMSMGNLLRPRLAVHAGRADRQEVRRMVATTLVVLSAGGILLTFVFAIFGEQIGRLVFGDTLAGLGAILPLASAFATVESIGACMVIVVQTTRFNGAAEATAARTITAVVALTVMWHACSAYGAIGAFVVALIAEMVFVALMLATLVLSTSGRRVPAVAC